MGIKSYRWVELVAKLNFRYYLVSISGRYYIIDYANPSDIKDYFIGIFPERVEKYQIYDVNTDYKNFLVNKKVAFIFKNFYNFIFILFSSYLNFSQKYKYCILNKIAFNIRIFLSFYFIEHI